MKIGFKYCGGCNPGFDRVGFVKLLKQEFAELTFENADKNTCYDLIIIINGCIRACANNISLNYQQIFYVTKETDFDNVKKVILNLTSINNN